MKIEAMVVRDHGAPFTLEALDLDEPRPHEVLVRIVATGMCHTDLAVSHLKAAPFPLPFVLGHEGAGVVERIGSAVTDCAPGDHVVLTFNSCGDCAGCSDGHESYCVNFGRLNITGFRPDGSTTLRRDDEVVHGSFFSQSSFATYALAHERNVVRVSTRAPLERLGPLGCGVQTGAGSVLNVLRPAPGASIAIFGAGAVGLSAVMAAKISRCAEIVIVDPLANRLELARELGATTTVQAGAEDPREVIKQLGGVDFTVEASGAPASVEAAITSVKPQGKCVLIASGKPGATVTLPIRQLTGGKTIFGVREGDSSPKTFIPHLVELHLAGRLPFDRLVTFYDFADINQAAADSLSGAVVKPIIRIGRPL
jgi:aryl-alcohol dehydrogenase